MPWIESHTTLARHPKTLRLARHLGLSVPCAIGHLHLLWWWALEYAEAGDVSAFDAEEIALACQWDGAPDVLLSGLRRAGFIEETGALHDWWDYAGKWIEQRKANAEKQRRWRDAHKPVTSSPYIQAHNGDVTVTSPARTAATVPNLTKPNPTKPPSPPTPADATATAAPLALRAVPKPVGASDHQALWDAFTAIFGTARSQKERDKRGKACREARESSPPISAEEVRAAADNWPNVMGDATMTELGLVGNLGKLLEGPQRNGRSNGTVRAHKQTVYESAAVHHRPSVADIMRERDERRGNHQTDL